MICQIMYIHSLCIDPPPKHLPTAVHPMSYNVSQNYHESEDGNIFVTNMGADFEWTDFVILTGILKHKQSEAFKIEIS